MAPSVIAVAHIGTDTEWLIRELQDQLEVVDRRKRPGDDGVLVAPFASNDLVAQTLDEIWPDWHAFVEIIHPGPEAVERMMN